MSSWCGPRTAPRRRTAFERSSTPSVRSQRARLRTGFWRRRTVSRLWFRMSGRAAMTSRSGASSPLKSGISTSTPMPGTRSRSSADRVREDVGAAVGQIVAGDRGDHHVLQARAAGCASATRRGSSSSNQVGRPVLTLQKPHARVQVSPRIMIVAVRWSQHSPMFGQWASSQTVLRFRPRSRRLRSW